MELLSHNAVCNCKPGLKGLEIRWFYYLFIYLFLLLVAWGIEPGYLHMLGQDCPSEVHTGSALDRII